jgi:hypothetical protein
VCVCGVWCVCVCVCGMCNLTAVKQRLCLNVYFLKYVSEYYHAVAHSCFMQCLLCVAINILLPDFWIISRLVALVSAYKGFNFDPNLKKKVCIY